MNAEEADAQIASRWKAAKEHHSGPEFGQALERALLTLVAAELSRSNDEAEAIDKALGLLVLAQQRLDRIKELRDRL